jgi:DNA-binding CsgD family transcriptional regulator
MLSFCGLQYLNAPFGAVGLDFPDRLARAHQALEITQAISWRSGQALSTVALANLLGYHGIYREANAYIKRGLALAEELHHHYWRTLANLVQGAIRLDLLQVDAGVSSLETAFQLAREANSDYWARITSGHLIPALLELGRVGRAREIVDTVTTGQAALGVAPGELTIGQRHAWLARAELSLAEGRAQYALDIADSLKSTIPAAPLAVSDLRGRCLEALGRHGEAQAVWRAALAAAEAAGVRPQVWRFHARLARSLRTIGRRSEAAEHAAGAWTILDTLASQLTEDEARQLTHAAAASVPRGTDRERRKERFAGLTDREREVAAWVGQGLSNPDIARRMSLSSRTVEKHVEHVMAKLGATSRAQVVAWSVRHQIVPEQGP